jgi:hypothetical protein
MFLSKNPRAFGAALAVAALVACSGGKMLPSADSVPSDSQQANAARALVPMVQFDPELARRLAPMGTDPFACTASFSKVPGKYAELVTVGTVKGTTFSSGKSLAEWIVAKFVKATPAPTPTPGVTPTPKVTPTPIVTAPPGQPLYFYVGTYSLKKYGTGCAYLITSVNGKTIHHLKGNGEGVGFPNFRGDTQPVEPITQGPLNLTIKNLSSKGGNGTAVLLNAQKGGGIVDSGTVTLTGRIEIKP